MLMPMGIGVSRKPQKFVGKENAEILTISNRTATLAYTDLDLTAYTSPNAKYAKIGGMINVDSVTAGANNQACLSLRKNGTTPTWAIVCWVDGGVQVAGSRVYFSAMVEMDSGQVIEYGIVVSGTIQFDTYMWLEGYIE